MAENDYFDAVVVGGGTAGCIVAGRLAERGINPKTGDRLRVAMIEGGDDWTIRDPGIRPGYGYPIRRQMLSNINYEEIGPETPGPDYRWPWSGENFKLVGGCSVHYGGNTYIPVDEDFYYYREASGVDWTLGKFELAIEEIREMYHITSDPEGTWTKGIRMFTDAGRALGFDMRPCPVARRNCLDTRYCGDAHMCRQDSKGTSLPWAYIGLNHGLQVIANAEAEKILIEKPAGGPPVATGVVYKDKAGAMHQVRAARVIVACGTTGTALLLYKSGYGPRELLGNDLIVENKNVGQHLDGDSSNGISAYFPEDITPATQGGTGYTWTTMKPRPWGELNVQIWAKELARNHYPHTAALSSFAPEFGWKHKEYMRSGAHRRIGVIVNRLQLLPWSWQLTRDGRIEKVSVDEKKIDATLKEAAELTYAWYEKMAVKPLQIDRNLRRATTMRPGHDTGTARAGANRDVSVCSSDFDCHDIDHLMITSGASMPRTAFCHAAAPIAIGGAYAWRRIVANHFTKGSSTKGYA